MPERPDHTKDHGLPKPVHIVADGILTVALPADFFDHRSQEDRDQRASDSHPREGEVTGEGKLIYLLAEKKRQKDGTDHDQSEYPCCQKDVGPSDLVEAHELVLQILLQLL